MSSAAGRTPWREGDRYEGGYSFPVYAAELPGGPVVTPINPMISWTAVRAEQGEDFFYQLMAVDLPEEAAGGRLTVMPGPGAGDQTVEGTRDRGIIPFYPTGDWLDIDVRNDTAWTLGGWGSLKGKAYTLTLWDEDGAVISETGGTLGSIWEKAAR